jgi:hypothetical protein
VEEGFTTVAQRVAVSLAGLMLPATVIGIVALFRLRRYPVAG